MKKALIFSLFLSISPNFAHSAPAKKKASAPAAPVKASSKIAEMPAPLDSLARQIASSLKSSKAFTVVVPELAYLDGKMSTGSSVIQTELMASLAKFGASAFSKYDVDFALRELKLPPGPMEKAETVLAVARFLKADAAIHGDLKDLKSKNKVDVHAIVYLSAGRKIIGGGSQSILKTWKDPVTSCGNLAYVSVSTAVFTPQGSANNVQFIFTEPWMPARKIGKIDWNFCRKDGKTPNLNDALPDLKKKAWEMGGTILKFEQNDLDSDNPKVLLIKADVYH